MKGKERKKGKEGRKGEKRKHMPGLYPNH